MKVRRQLVPGRDRLLLPPCPAPPQVLGPGVHFAFWQARHEGPESLVISLQALLLSFQANAGSFQGQHEGPESLVIGSFRVPAQQRHQGLSGKRNTARLYGP